LDLADTESHGRVLTLDGRVMLSERDEFFYHEMLVHPALLAHPFPTKVLIVGGGDGGALRETLRHPVDQVILAEIDREVIEVAREWLPSVHQGAFDDRRVTVVVSPGEEFLPQYHGEFDVILVDSSDPVGPGAALFEPRFFRACQKALNDSGILALQSGSPHLAPAELQSVVGFLRSLFPYVLPYLGFAPLYPSGLWSYVLASKREIPDEGELWRRHQARGLRTRYFTPAVFRAATVLPPFLEELLSPCPNG
jgi:spermidine synthase